MNTEINQEKNTRIIASNKTWVESISRDQLVRASQLPGMKLSIGMPDIHPGKGYPVGAVFISQNYIYPYLIGNDIGCGISFAESDLPSHKMKRDKIVQKLTDLEEGYPGNIGSILGKNANVTDFWSEALGTLGGGNHFIEFQKVEQLLRPLIFEKLRINPKNLFLTVHSGSRGFGDNILRKVVRKHKDHGIETNNPDALDYLKSHEQALLWARSNREVICHHFLSKINAKGKKILDVPHNYLIQKQINGSSYWIHRKGAVDTNNRLILIPGTRGDFSYLVSPLKSDWDHGFSVAHGAGRKWQRKSVKGRLSHKVSIEQLKITKLGNKVICDDKDLLWEEAPEGYKKIETVIESLKEEGLIKVVAILRPVVTYKNRKRTS